jgi:hypothetical protein
VDYHTVVLASDYDAAVAELRIMREAFGPVSTLAPHRIADPSHPIEWAQGIERDVSAERDKLKAKVERVRTLSISVDGPIFRSDIERALADEQEGPKVRGYVPCGLDGCRGPHWYDTLHGYGKCVERRKCNWAECGCALHPVGVPRRRKADRRGGGRG